MYFQVIALAKIKSFLDSYNHFLFDVIEADLKRCLLKRPSIEIHKESENLLQTNWRDSFWDKITLNGFYNLLHSTCM